MQIEKRILHLTLLRNWFNQIARGEKKEEYRQIKHYWACRLWGKEFDEIHFTNGYGGNRPFMRVEWKGIKVSEWRGEQVYAIQLGAVLETKNYTP